VGSSLLLVVNQPRITAHSQTTGDMAQGGHRDETAEQPWLPREGSMTAARLLQQCGITQVTSVGGGTTVWQMHGLPIEGGKR